MFQASSLQHVFQSVFPHSVDVKGRVSLPSPFRSVLGGDDKVVVWPSFGAPDQPCYLEGGRSQITSFYMNKLPPESRLRQLAAHYIVAESRSLGFDSTGRILLPQEFMDHAGIGKQALFVGLYERFQIWNPETHAVHKAALDRRSEDRAELAACMGLGLP